MKSIKPGRGPSMMSGVLSILAGIFGVVWIIIALSNGGGFIAIFGLIFVVIAIVQAVYHFTNATGKDRYSSFDIVDGQEEPDPLNRKFSSQPENPSEIGSASRADRQFCPYCGAPVDRSFAFCQKCGKKQPE